mmetsp:Transcript_131040/g.195290  ORF Transcript_131040/g.195290 Transcript_131040/m.195290 type:complete len:213 (+) Transcript_131040:147-785(+)
MFLCPLVDLGGRSLDIFDLIVGQVRDKLGWVATPFLSSRNASVGRDNRAWLQHDIGLHESTLHNSAFFSNYHQIIDAARFEHRSSSNGDVVTNVADRRESSLQTAVLAKRSNDTALSDAGVKADCNRVGGICSHNGAVPDAGLIPISNLSDDRSRRSDKSVVRDKRRQAQEGHLRTMPRKDRRLIAKNGACLSKPSAYGALKKFTRHGGCYQ